jgi:hypothetical protein
MDKLERFKTENEGNDAVHDDVAAQAYVEQFAMETFQRADKVLRAKKATKLVGSDPLQFSCLTNDVPELLLRLFMLLLPSLTS